MPQRLAIVCSAHGFGHLTRQLALAEALRARGSSPTLFTAAPRNVVDDYIPGIEVVPWTADVGIAQRDSLTEDLPETLRRLERVCAPAAIEALARALEGFDRVVVDIAPPALEACRRAGVEAVAVGNFDWAWIYAHYPELAAWSERFAAWQAPHVAASLWPGPGLRGFARVRPFGLVGRRRPPWTGAGRYGLVCFGGFGLDGLSARLPRVPGLRWVTAPPMAPLDRRDALHVTDVSYPSLVAGAAVVVTKPGYGVFAEAALAGVRLAWLPRGAFPEAPWIEAELDARGDQRLADPLEAGLLRALSAPPPPRVARDEAGALADWLLKPGLA